MVDKKLVDYVNSAMKSGQPVDEIRAELLKQGWSEKDVNKVVSMFQEKVPEKEKIPERPEREPVKKPATESHRAVYITGLVIVIIVVGVTAFYVMSLPPIEAPEKCGNEICDPGENYENCPQDCEAPAPPTPPTGPTTISVSPSTESVSNGDTFTLEVKASDAYDLFGFQFNVEYDSNILEFQSAGEGTFLKKDGRSTFCVDYNTETAGLVKNIACTRLGRGSVSGEGVLETLTFKAIGTGTSGITLSNVKLANSKAERIESSVSGGEVTVS
jgi:hypothetical protein